MVIFGYFPDQTTPKALAFLSVAGVVDDQIFAIVSDEKVAKDLELDAEVVVMYKNVSSQQYF